MSDNSLPRYDDTCRALADLALGVGASELHGGLCGFLCGGGVASPRHWLQQLALEPADSAAVDALKSLFDASCSQLLDPDLGFELLMPESDRPLGERADALIAWTQGFLGGFGLAAGENPALSEEAAEALQDLSAIAGASLSCDDPDSDEESLMEVCEFVRVVALLLHGDREPPRPDASRLH